MAHRTTLLLVALGGAFGSVGRYAVALAFPHEDGSFAWSTLLANVSGSLLLGVLMGLLATVWAQRAWVRPLLGVGVLGGYTTFSTAMLDLHSMVLADPRAALAYLAATVVLGLGAALFGLVVGRAAGDRVARTRLAAPAREEPR